MTSFSRIKQQIIEAAKDLIEPQNYFKGLGKKGALLDNILILSRSAERTINRGKSKVSELRHKRYVLTINLMTDGIAVVNEKPLTMPENSGFLIYPYQNHHYIVDQTKFNWLVFTFESLEPYVNSLMYRPVTISEDAYELIFKLLKIYLALQKEETDINNELLCKYLECLLLELRKNVVIGSQHTSTKREANRKLQLFEKVNGYILRYLSDIELSVEAIAEKHYVSVSFLHKLFKNMTNRTPGEYIRFLRIDRAKKLLQHSNVTVAEVAERAGFSSPAIFSRCFRREVGMSPQMFMKLTRE